MAHSEAMAWLRLRRKLVEMQRVGQPVPTLQLSVVNTIVEIGEDYVILYSVRSKTGKTRRIDAVTLGTRDRGPNGAIIRTLRELGDYPPVV